MTIHYTTNQTRFTFSLIHLKQVTSAPWTKTGLPKRKNFQRPRNNGMRCEGTVRNSRSQRMFLVLMCNLLRKFTNVCIGFIGYQFLGVAGSPSNFMTGGPSTGSETSLSSHWGYFTSVATGATELPTRPAEGGDCIEPGVISTTKKLSLWTPNPKTH